MSTPALAEQLPRPGRVPLVEVVITEPIDARVVPRLRALLDEALALRPEHLVVDLAGCPMIDASGVAALLDIHRKAMRDGGRLSLRAPSASVHRNLQLARAANVLHIVLPEVALPAEDWSAAAGTGRTRGPAAGAMTKAPLSPHPALCIPPPGRGEAGVATVHIGET